MLAARQVSDISLVFTSIKQNPFVRMLSVERWFIIQNEIANIMNVSATTFELEYRLIWFYF